MIKTEKFMGALKKYKYAAVILLVGLVFLCWPAEEKETAQKSPAAAEASFEEIEERMEKILSAMAGVGEVELMLTVDAGSELLLAGEENLTYSGSTAAPENYERQESVVVLSGSDGEEVVVTKSIYPVYRGALVVCDGGDEARVKLAVTEAVSALTGLSSEKISVIKKQS